MSGQSETTTGAPTRRGVAALFFRNEMEIENLREKVSQLTEENKRLMETYPYLRPMKGHLKEKPPR